MAEENVNKEVIHVMFLCIIWYTTSSCNNVIGKTLLNEFPYPLTVTIVQLLSITLYSGPALKCMRIQPRRKADISWSYYKKLIIPLAFGKFLAVVFSHISLWKVPVSYAHTVKATMPFFTVILARILIGEKQSIKIYFSLIPIIIGVAIASITEIFFDIVGLVSALVATCAFSLLHIYSKQVLNETGIHHLRLLHLLGKLALVLFLPIWIVHDAYALILDKSLLTRRDPFDTALLLFLDGLLNWMQNLLAFTILSRVSPVTYAVANASKRISVITISLLLLRNPVTSTNVFGMLLAVLGVLGYNKSKYDDNMAKKRAALVPLSQVISAVPLNHKSMSNGIHSQHFLNGFPNGIPAFQNGTNRSVTVNELARFLPHPLQTAPFDLNTPLVIPSNFNSSVNGHVRGPTQKDHSYLQ